MVSHRELVAYVRFQLEQLSSRNGQHEFEHLCQQLARLRICSNILPATGPVSARGDQGRDAETFRAYLANSSLASSTFVGLVADRPLAFAFTLQKRVNNLKGKIERDIATIVAGSRPVAEVHYFCGDDLDVGTRHLVQDWAQREHGVVLEIYDGQAISDLLCWPDTFWIATEYLHVPSEMYPEAPSDGADGWYRSLLATWREEQNQPLTFAAFAEVKSALRHCTFTRDRQSDLPFWMEKVEAFLADDVPPMLRHRAMYELAVAGLRGLGTMEGHDERLADYFPAVIGSDLVADLEDAAVLVTYCLGAIRNHATQLREDTIVRWRDELVEALDHQLASDPTVGRWCDLMSILGFLVCSSRGYGVPVGDRSAIRIWLELATRLDEAHLFPVNRLAEQLVVAIPILGDDPRFDELTKRLDVLVADRAGQAAAAERCRDRAMAFYEQGKLLRAIAELHEAKVMWFGEETLLGSVLAMLFIARCYQEFGLHYAAKYYAMAAAWVSIQSERQMLRDKIWEALILASDCDYLLGNWRGYLQLTDLGMKSHWWLARRAGDYDTHSGLDRVFYHATICQAVAERMGGDFAAAVWGTISEWGLSVEIETLMPNARDMLAKLNDDEMLDFAAKQLSGRPFADLSTHREAVWEALGITWRVRWRNDPAANATVEEFVSTLQVAFTDFAKHDLLLIQTEAEIEVEVGDVASPQVVEDSSNSGRRWRVVLPASSGDRKEAERPKDVDLLGIAVYVLREASFLPQDQFSAALEDVLKAGITAKVFFARPYDDLFRQFCAEQIPIDELAVPERLIEVDRPTAAPAHQELRWRDGLAPGYDAVESHEAIARRYERIPRKIPVTLARLAQSPSFQRTRAILVEEGWKDWHILLAVLNAALNVRMHALHGPTGPTNESSAEMERAVRDLADDLELESLIPIDLERFSADELRRMMDIGMATVLKTWGLEIHQFAPDFTAIRNFLTRRYNFWTDDIEHEDPFSAQPPTGILSIASG